MKIKTYIGLFLLFFLPLSQAQNTTQYPSRPIKLIVPFSPGSASDILARTIGERLQNSFNQAVIIENRPGAGGTIASAQVAKTEADGYTLLVVSAGQVVNPSMYKNLSYDTLKDFRGVIPFASLPSVLVVPSASNFKNVNEFVDFARNHSGELIYVSGGVGSASHMNAEKFAVNAKIKALHVPLKGASDMAIEIASGRAQFGFMPLIAALPMIKDGKLKPLAVSSDARSSALPDIPSISEAGQAGGVFNFWIGLIAPSKTPTQIVQRLNSEITKIVQTPEMKERFVKLGAESFVISPEQFDRFIEAEYKTMSNIMSQVEERK